MKRLLLLGLLLVTAFISDEPFLAFNFDHKWQASGKIITYGDSSYGTGINLSGDTVISGDSSVVQYLFRQNDTDNQSSGGYHPHRSYVDFGFFRYGLGADTLRFFGKSLDCPCFIEFWYLESNVVLHGHGPGKIADWSSPLTVTADSTNGWPDVVTLTIDTTHRLGIEHAPIFDSTARTFQMDNSNDPLGKHKVDPDKWHLMQFLYMPAAYGAGSGYAKAWLDTTLVSSANVIGRPNFINQLHIGLYCAAAVKPIPGKDFPRVYNNGLVVRAVTGEDDARSHYITGRVFPKGL